MTEFEINLSTVISDPMQCAVCGQPNVFGYLCDDCKAKLSALESADADTRRKYLILGLRCDHFEFKHGRD